MICGQIGLPHAVIRVGWKPIAEQVSGGQNPVRDRSGGNAAKEFVKGLPALLFWLRLIWVGNGGMIMCQALVGENARRQLTCARKTQFAEPLNLEIQSN